MKNIIAIILFLSFLSCNSKENKDIIVFFPDSTNYKYERVNDTLQKVIRYFPETKMKSNIYFFNTKTKLNDSTLYSFNKEGYLEGEVTYANHMRVRNGKIYFRNGKLKEEFISINGFSNMTSTYYYETGEIKMIQEVIEKDSKPYINTVRRFKKNGEPDKEKTYYYDMELQKDTISINDSVFVKMVGKIPRFAAYRLYIGALDENFNIIDEESIRRIKMEDFYFKPDSLGENYIRTCFEVKVSPENEEEYILKMYKEEKVFVIK